MQPAPAKERKEKQPLTNDLVWAAAEVLNEVRRGNLRFEFGDPWHQTAVTIMESATMVLCRKCKSAGEYRRNVCSRCNGQGYLYRIGQKSFAKP